MRSFEVKAIGVTAAAFAAALLVGASCSRVADDCQLNVTCPGDGVKAGSGGAGGSGGQGVSASESASTSTSTGASSGTGGTLVCVPGMLSSCYDGPLGTENVGVCKSGMHACQDDGSAYGACTNQVLPSAENCVQPADEDCDGKAAGCTGATLEGGDLGTAGTDEIIFAVAADSAGSAFLGGVSGATPPSGQVFAISSGDAGINKILKDGSLAWSVVMQSSGGGGYSVVRGLAVDQQGNVLAVGEFQGTMTEGAINVTSAGGSDIFLVKLDPTGKTLWAKAFGNPADQAGYAVAVDQNGNVFITGQIVGGVNFGGGVVSAGAGNNLFVTKLDATGNHLWSKAFGDDANQAGYSVAATPEGDVVVAGELGGTVDFGVGITLKSSGGTDVFVAKLAGAGGATTWANRYGDVNNQTANGVAVGSDGSVVLTGSIVGTCDFGGGPLKANGGSNVFVTKLHPDGSHDWSHGYGSDIDNQAGLGVAIDPAQNILVVGYLKGTITFGGTILTDASAAQNTDMFVAKLSAAGAPVWARGFGDVNDQTAWAVTADSAKNVFFAGTFAGTVNLPPSITSMGSYDGFWAKLAP
ncbi:MAG: hypothetical protein ABJE95_00135 [Byssovorax sp.]